MKKTAVLILIFTILSVSVACMWMRGFNRPHNDASPHILMPSSVDLSTLEAEYKDYLTQPAFNTDIPREKVCSITFLGTLKDVPETAADASQTQDGSVRAWAVQNIKLYDLYIAADGGVTAPENCSALFACMPNLNYIKFGKNFNTSRANNMSAMFYRSYSLSKLELKNFDTSQVTDMSAMFKFCDTLPTVDLRSFETSKVEDMSEMFYGGLDIESLDLRHFDTSAVTDMSAMFCWCGKLERLKLGDIDSSKVDTTDMFNYCRKLDLSKYWKGN